VDESMLLSCLSGLRRHVRPMRAMDAPVASLVQARAGCTCARRVALEVPRHSFSRSVPARCWAPPAHRTFSARPGSPLIGAKRISC
jgi:hypothetical protein